MKRISLLILYCFFCFPLVFFAQKKQPTVGLVLSGGGVKGFAHIGILEELEKAGVQVDYIGGTSMGAIVGGLYAAGYSASQVKQLILKTDFFDLLQDKNPRRSQTIFEKIKGENYALLLPVNKGRIGLPQAVSKGQNVLNFLTYLLAPVVNNSDFSTLPIPFFCMATDVETGKSIKLSKGFLPLALRASGSFPTLLSPVEIDGKLLIDGGVVNNFPVDEMKKIGVDIIIGVDVQGKLYDKDKIVSVLDLLNQIASYQIYQNSAKQIAETDVYIHPKVSNYSVVGFENKKIILEAGEMEAAKFAPVFDSIAALQTHKRVRKPIELNYHPKYLINEIEIKGNVNYTRAFILGTLKLAEGDVLSVKEVADRIDYLSSTNNFQRIDFRFKDNGKGKKLILNVKESKDKTNIKLGIHYDLVYESSVLVNYTHKNLLTKNDELSADFIIGDNPRYRLNYFVDNGLYYSYGFSSSYNRFNASVNLNINNVNFIDLQYTDFTNRIYVQTSFDRKFAIGLGFETKKVKFGTNTVSNPNNQYAVYENSNYFNTFSYINLDTYDDKYFPTKGVQFDANFTWYLSSSDFNNDFTQFSQAKGKVGVTKTFFKNFVFQFTTEAGFTLGTVASENFDFSLGGYNQNFVNNFIPFYGYNISELTNQSFLKSTFQFRQQIIKNQYLSFYANYARVESNVFKQMKLFDKTKSGYALGYSLSTFLGPIDLKYSWSPDTNNHFWYFNLGFWF